MKITFEEFVEKYQVIREVISNLTENQKEVFLDRVGITMKHPTLQEVADKRNISRTRVKQIENLTLEKIYKTLKEIEEQKDK